MKVISFGKTDQGKTRTNNEDAFLVNDLLGLYAVADGIGGHEGGEIASRLTVEALSGMLREQFAGSRSVAAFGDSPEADKYLSLLRDAVALANTTVRQA